LSQAITEAIVLAGGLGTRLHSVISDKPKSMAVVRGRPFLEFLFDHWVSQGIQHFIVSTGYRGEAIRDHFGAQYKQATISFVHENEPRGTGGAVKLVLSSGCLFSDQALLFNGDTWFPADLRELNTVTVSEPVCMCVTDVSVNERYGSVLIGNSNNVVGFGLPTHGPSLINAGVYSLHAEGLMRYLLSMPDCFSLERDTLSNLVENFALTFSRQPAPFLDIGTPDDYLKAAAILPIK